MSRKPVSLLAAFAVLSVMPSLAQTASRSAQRLSPATEFVPDWTFSGSVLTGWQTVGGASWKAENGEIIGTSSGNTGLLVLDKSFQDAAFFSHIKCDGSCDAGVLLRAEKTANGMKGIFVSIKEGDMRSYSVTLDAAGKIVTREAITNTTWGTIRTGGAPTPPANGGNGGGGGGQARGAGPGDFLGGIKLSTPLPELAPPPYGFSKQTGGWDEFSIIYDSNIVRPYLNKTNQYAPSITGDTDGYGPIALYVGGTGTTHFKDVSVKDLAERTISLEKVSSRFRMQKLEEFSYAWGVDGGDINHDGIMDIVAGPYYYLGPDYTKRHEIFLGQTYNPGREYAPDMVSHVFDFNGDGWPDVIATESRPMVLYINPKGENRRWKRYAVLPTANSESTIMKDIDGDGRPEIIFTDHGVMTYAKYDPADVTRPWPLHKVSEAGLGIPHSIGAADLNADGRIDIIGADGWWEQPASGAGDGPWKYHPVAFGRWGRSQTPGGGDIYTYDVNGDGLIDVVTTLHGHGWGLAWFEQKKSSGEITFVRHMIMDNYSTVNAGGVTIAEAHGFNIGDVDGDGIPDLITGKRYWSHNDSYFDPDSYGDAVLYWYKTVRNPKAPGGAEFVPELIHNRSGVGSQVLVTDLNKDHALDIVTATVKGTFIFWGKPKTK